MSGGSLSARDLRRSSTPDSDVAKMIALFPGYTPRPLVTVTWSQLESFLFPSNLEHPESTGRLELFARYGPVDQNGCLHGGRNGRHVHTNAEIRRMIKNELREALFAACKQPRDLAELIVDQLLPVAVKHSYTLPEIQQILQGVRTDKYGRMEFSDLQDTILANQQERLKLLVKGGAAAILKERGPVVPYQNLAAETLRAVTRKKKLTHAEEEICRRKKLQTGCTLIAALEEQHMTNTLTANTQLIRDLGPVSDRWDRYCALRRTGKSSYVEARNEQRPSANQYDDLKHEGCSNLISAGMLPPFSSVTAM